MRLAKCCTRFGQNVRDELWSYFALLGILFVNTSIVLLVYAYKRATPFPAVVEAVGISLLVLGVLSTLASWLFHRQQRQKKRACVCPPCCCRWFHARSSVTAVAAVTAVGTPASPSSSASSMRKAKFSRGNGRLAGGSAGEAIVGERGAAAARDGGARRPFSTPEFRRYAEFMSQKTTGVERGLRRSKLGSPRFYRGVHPGKEKPGPGFVNPRFKADDTNSASRSSDIEAMKTTTMHVTLQVEL